LDNPSQVERARRRLSPRSAEVSIEQIQRVVCDPVRLRMVQALSVGPLCVQDLAVVVDREPAGTSQHLRALRRVGIVEGVRRGRRVDYRLRAGPAAEHLSAVLRALERSPQPDI
jgi:DNA-binding transcriptional ArsR family regulator